MGDDVRIVEDNVEATEAWNGPLFDVWLEYRGILTEGILRHGEQALALEPPREGDRVLDIGCGLGDTTFRLAQLVGPRGRAHGVDVAERMITTAIGEAAEAGLESVTFATCDVEVTKFEQTFDYEAIAVNLAIGPGAEVLRMWGDRVDDVRPRITADLRDALADLVIDGGAVVAASSTWAVTARAPF